MRISRWLPLIAAALAVLLALNSVITNPLPANGYGRSIHDVHETLIVPAGSSRTILMAEGSVVPSHSLVLVVAGVMNRQPGSDLSETAYFRLTHDGGTIAQGDVSPFFESFETRVESVGADNPALFIRNDHSFDLAIDYSALITRPPSNAEHFGLYLPVLIPLLAGAILWAVFYRRDGRVSGQPI